MGLSGTDWELDLKQYSFRHIMQVLRVSSFSACSLSPAFPPCSCPLAFQRQVRRLTSRISSESYPGVQEYVVSCHGAAGSDNGHYGAHGPALRNAIRTWCVVREGLKLAKVSYGATSDLKRQF
jgi:hypothetical protein